MILGRLLGWFFIGAAVALFGYDLLEFLDTQSWHSLLLGELWFRLDAASLNLAQAVIQRYIAAALWDPIILTVLLWPASLIFLALGLILLLLSRRRKPKDQPAFER